MNQGNSEHNTDRLESAGLPPRVLSLCSGLLDLGSDFCERQLQATLKEFEASLLNRNSVWQPDIAQDRGALIQARHDLIPHFLAALESHLAGIRKTTCTTPASEQISTTLNELKLLDASDFNVSHRQAIMIGRCESRNSHEIFLLGQRFGVLAAAPAFNSQSMPMGPKQLCLSFHEAIACLDLNPHEISQIYSIFDRQVLDHYAELLLACNTYLSEHGILPNLRFVPYRNPELRMKRASPHVLEGSSKNAAQKPESAKIYALFPDAESPKKTGVAEQDFSVLQHMLAQRKRLLDKLNAFSKNYIGGDSNSDSTSSAASPQQIDSILHEIQSPSLSKHNTDNSIRNIKHDLLARLHSHSANDHELTLHPEDSDAIDLTGLLFDHALRKIQPGSPAAQLIRRMQTPLVQVVIRDKSFFSDRTHPARDILNNLTDIGLNWLDGSEIDEGLQTVLYRIINPILEGFDGDHQKLFMAHEESKRLLLSLTKKADILERRQIDVLKAKEKMLVAQQRAERTMSALIAEHSLPPYTRTMLEHAWTDAMALTELRSGIESEEWIKQRSIAKTLAAANSKGFQTDDVDTFDQLRRQIQKSLSQVGYHEEDAIRIAMHVLNPKSESDLSDLTHKPRLGEIAKTPVRQPLALNTEQIILSEQLKQLPIGTWFEFSESATERPTRAKLTWFSLASNLFLFVNQRGHKVAEMTLEELAITVSEGRAWILTENKLHLFENAFEEMIISLRNFLPEKKD